VGEREFTRKQNTLREKGSKIQMVKAYEGPTGPLRRLILQGLFSEDVQPDGPT
jgi:hypothetical protein